MCLFFFACAGSREPADTLYYNGTVYTVDSSFSVVSSFAVKDGKITAVGDEALRQRVQAAETIDLQGHPVYPGFIDAHSHFFGYSTDLVKCDLYGTASFGEVIDRVVRYAATNRFSWILGRGWDQNDWDVKEYPSKSVLDSLFPNIPVFLMRVDGHAILVNQAAINLAGIHVKTRIEGGIVQVVDGQLTGILIDNAVDSVKSLIPPFTDELKSEALLIGQANCFGVGLTSVSDAGIDLADILLIDSLHRAGSLKIRDYAMITYNRPNTEYFFTNGPLRTGRLHAGSFKIYADGALGSRGGCLLEPYTDQPGHHGFMLTGPAALEKACEQVYRHGFQMCTHCIGDSANRLVLQLYGALLDGPNDRRWRIEHCQVVHPDDFPLFGKYGIIPSVQPTHATSDMYWVESRLGPGRMGGAYAYKTLLSYSGLLAAGSDFPVESINPLFGFYAAVARKDQKGFPGGGFGSGEALTREEALRAMTSWAAWAAMEEDEKGSIEPGKYADFVILEEDIMKVPAGRIFDVKVKETFVGGERVFYREP